jgi:Icc-related predicted phosphoesterase
VRILAMADLHGNHEIYRRIPGLLDRHRADALVLAVDLLGTAPGFTSIEDAQEADATDILGILERVAPGERRAR